MYGFFVRRDEKKVVFVYGCLLAEVRLYNIFEVPIYSSMYTVIVWIKYNQTCFAFWKVLSLWNLAFYLLIFWVLREGVSYWSIVFYFLGSPRHIFGFWFLPSFNHHHHLKSPRPPGGGGGLLDHSLVYKDYSVWTISALCCGVRLLVLSLIIGK